MPTENRSSNTEMVSVPREHELKIRQTPLADLLSGLKTGEIRDCSDREFAVGDTVLLREIDDGRDYTGTVARRTITHVQKHYGLPDHLCVLSYGQPAPQPHPEPIAWMVGTAFWWTKEEAERDAAATGLPIVGLGPMTSIAPAQHQGEPVTLPERKDPTQQWHIVGGVAKAEGWNACLDEIAKLGPLYTHADPGEVERLRAQLAELEALHGGELGLPKEGWPAYHKRKMESLRDLTTGFYERKLAERDELLRESLCHAQRLEPMSVSCFNRIDAALSASAEPSAPASQPGKCLDGGDCGIGGTCKWCPHTTASPAQQPS